MATGPFSPSRTVKRVHACAARPWRHCVTDCHGVGGTATPVIHGPWRLQVTHGGGARDPQHIALATLAQRVVAYPMPADNVSRLPPSRLSRVIHLVISTRNR